MCKGISGHRQSQVAVTDSGNGGLQRRFPLPGMEAQGNSRRRRRRRLQPLQNNPSMGVRGNHNPSKRRARGWAPRGLAWERGADPEVASGGAPAAVGGAGAQAASGAGRRRAWEGREREEELRKKVKAVTKGKSQNFRGSQWLRQ